MGLVLEPRGYRLPQEFNRVTIGKTGSDVETAYLRTDGLLRQSSSNQCLRFINVTPGGSPATIEVHFSFDSPEVATNREANSQAATKWVKQGDVAVGAPLVDDLGQHPTAIKLVFSAPGGCVITCS